MTQLTNLAMSENKSTDILGVAPYGEALKKTVEKSFEGIEGFLKSVCMPALDEVGLMLKDKVRYWRLNNILRMLEKSKDKFDFIDGEILMKAHPRVALSIIENGSLNDNDEVQELWAGLFASSCTIDGQDDENLIFVDLLKQITTTEARILKYVCINARKMAFKIGLVTAMESFELNGEQLIEISGIQNIVRLDRELDHLNSLNLIGSNNSGGIMLERAEVIANVTPTALALNFYVRCQGSSKSPMEFWKDSIISYEQLRSGIIEESRMKEQSLNENEEVID